MDGFDDNELSKVKEIFSNDENLNKILFLSKEYIQVIISKTPFRKLSARIQWKEGYPKTLPLIELSSKTLLDSVLDKIKESIIIKLNESLKKSPLILIIELLIYNINGNKLLYVKEEIDKIKELLSSTDSIKLNYKQGTIIIHQIIHEYYAKFKVFIPDEYPSLPVKFKFIKSNFHSYLITIFTKRVEYLIQRILKGGFTFSFSSYIKKNDKNEEDEEEDKKWIPSSNDLHEIRKDLQFLKKIQDLKEHNDNKDMRRIKTRLIKAESKTMSEKEQKQLELNELMDQQQNIQKDIDKRTLYPVVGFIMKELIQRLPSLICIECNKSILPKNPPNDWNNTTLKDMDLSIRVDRLACNHWYHYKCLESIMSRPPFNDKICLYENCNESIKHPVFNIKYIRKMEQKWLKKEERKRELADIADFLS